MSKELEDLIMEIEEDSIESTSESDENCSDIELDLSSTDSGKTEETTEQTKKRLTNR